MRLAGQTKNGFFPIPPPVIDLILTHLRMPTMATEDLRKFRPDDLTVIDPCAGEGDALVQLAEGLGICHDHAYAIELNAARASRIRERYPDVKLLGPCSFEASQVTRHSFSLVYCNPPFDDEFGGGGREELSFVMQCRDLLQFRGILVLVCPLKQVYGNTQMCHMLDMYFDDVELFVFPKEHRQYGECVVIARRRRDTVLDKEKLEKCALHVRGIKSGYLQEAYSYGSKSTYDVVPVVGGTVPTEWQYGRPSAGTLPTGTPVWSLPFACPPRTWEKIAATVEEVEEFLDTSPLYAMIDRVIVRKLGRPPLGLNKGHTSLALLSGLLDGFVPSEPEPHVARGYTSKEEIKVRTEHQTTTQGEVIQKDYFAEIPKPCVRLVWPDGTIQTLTEKAVATGVVEADVETEEEDED